MSEPIVVHKHRTNVITVGLGIDVSGDTITSEIRSKPEVDAPLIATWNVEFADDGTDGELVLTLDDVHTSQITVADGYMDIKRVSGGEPLPVFDEPLAVVFRGSVTA